MLSAEVCQQLKATAPILKQHGALLSGHFYRRLFQHHPELRHIFNRSHQNSGQQQQALAMAVAAYAEHIENPSVLLPALERVAQKHFSSGVRPELYPIIGEHLLASIREVLGQHVASDSLLQAWGEAYQQLADLLIGLEQKLYQSTVNQAGGWIGFRSFYVVKKQIETHEVTSFYLQPTDHGALPMFQPGQYVSVQLYISELGLSQLRQYSLSQAPGKNTFRISVKREDQKGRQPAGLVSNLLHQNIQEGDVLQLSPPAGIFCLHQDRETPVVLISSGINQAPLMSMVQHLLAHHSQRDITYIHTAKNGQDHALKQELRTLAREHPNLKTVLFYQDPHPHEVLGLDYDHLGELNTHTARMYFHQEHADYYLCGSIGFIKQQREQLTAFNVPTHRIHIEVFGVNAMSVGS